MTLSAKRRHRAGRRNAKRQLYALLLTAQPLGQFGIKKHFELTSQADRSLQSVHPSQA